MLIGNSAGWRDINCGINGTIDATPINPRENNKILGFVFFMIFIYTKFLDLPNASICGERQRVRAL
jgi:hypothetical protein